MATKIERNRIVTPDQWLAARKQLLIKEKLLTHLRDDLSRERRALPWTEVQRSYVFEGPDGKQTLAGLFGGRSQLIVYHFMFGPGWEEGCPSCSFLVDHVDGALVHLNARDVSFVAVSRAPMTNIEAFRKRMGWRFQWVSSHDNSFNYDYHVSATDGDLARNEIYYNYDTGEFPVEDLPGISVFYKDENGDIYHTYSSYSRGLDLLIGTYNFLDLTPKGRDEQGLGYAMAWLRHHDRYDAGYTVNPNAKYAPPKGSACSHCAQITADQH